MTILAFVDVETDERVSDGERVCIEVAVALMDMESRSLIGCHSFLVKEEVMGTAQSVHGISPHLLQQYGYRADKINLSSLFKVFKPDYVISHGKFCEEEFIENDMDIPWLCTIDDFSIFPLNHVGGYSLDDLLNIYNIPRPGAHRAIADVLSMVDLFAAIPTANERIPGKRFFEYESIEHAIHYARRPRLQLIAPAKWKVDEDRELRASMPMNFRWVGGDTQAWAGRLVDGCEGIDTIAYPVAPYEPEKWKLAVANYAKKDYDLVRSYGFRGGLVKGKLARYIHPDAHRLYPFKVFFVEEDE